VINVEEESGEEVKKDRKMVLREERLKEGKKEERKTKRGKLLRKMTVKIRLGRIDT